MFKKTILIAFCFLFLFQLPTIGFDKTIYMGGLGLEAAMAVGGSPIYEYEKKISSNSSVAIQVYTWGSFFKDWLNPDEETGYSVLGIGGARKWYFTDEPFSGGYVGIGANLKNFRIKNFLSNELSSKGEGLFFQYFMEVGYAWRWFDPLICKIFYLYEQAKGISVFGSVGDQEGSHYSLGFKYGISFN